MSCHVYHILKMIPFLRFSKIRQRLKKIIISVTIYINLKITFTKIENLIKQDLKM